MNKIIITSHHGHLYDAESGKRIRLKEGANYRLEVLGEHFLEGAAFRRERNTATEEELKSAILSQKEIYFLKKVFDRGTNLYFRIEKALEDGSLKGSWFVIELLEDLFVYSKSKEDAHKKGRLFQCQCAVINCFDQELPFFESIYANSLSDIYKKTYVHYFGNQGSPNANVFEKIYIHPNTNPTYLLKNFRGFSEADIIKG